MMESQQITRTRNRTQAENPRMAWQANWPGRLNSIKLKTNRRTS